jgi:tRNA A37 threonylcarbamoyladenosine biosynthesis protein TsaE
LRCTSADLPLYHFDLYDRGRRGVRPALFRGELEGGGVSVIEWADRAGGRIPKESVKIDIEYVDSETRRIRIERPDN